MALSFDEPEVREKLAKDPAWLSTFDSWSRTDTEGIRRNVGPWFANRYSREHTQPPEGHRYYTVW